MVRPSQALLLGQLLAWTELAWPEKQSPDEAEELEGAKRQLLQRIRGCLLPTPRPLSQQQDGLLRRLQLLPPHP